MPCVCVCVCVCVLGHAFSAQAVHISPLTLHFLGRALLAVRDWYPLRALNHVHSTACIFSLLDSQEYIGDFQNPLYTFHSPSIFSQDLALTTDTDTESKDPACLPLRDQ